MEPENQKSILRRGKIFNLSLSPMFFAHSFICALLFALCVPAEAQQLKKIMRVGFLWDSPTVWPHAIEAFHRELRELGWIDGQNITFEYRWAEGQFDRLPGLGAELVRLKVDVIVAPTSIYAGPLNERPRPFQLYSRATQIRSVAGMWLASPDQAGTSPVLPS